MAEDLRTISLSFCSVLIHGGPLIKTWDPGWLVVQVFKSIDETLEGLRKSKIVVAHMDVPAGFEGMTSACLME